MIRKIVLSSIVVFNFVQADNPLSGLTGVTGKVTVNGVELTWEQYKQLARVIYTANITQGVLAALKKQPSLHNNTIEDAIDSIQHLKLEVALQNKWLAMCEKCRASFQAAGYDNHQIGTLLGAINNDIATEEDRELWAAAKAKEQAAAHNQILTKN